MLGGSGSRLAAGFVAAGLVLMLPSCTKPGRFRADDHVKDVEPVNILVVLNDEKLHVFPHRTHLKEGLQYPVWILIGAPDDAELFMEFKDPADTPLEDKPPKSDKEKHVFKKGVPKKDTNGKSYPYKVTVKVGGDAHTYILDPDIEVDK